MAWELEGLPEWARALRLQRLTEPQPSPWSMPGPVPPEMLPLPGAEPDNGWGLLSTIGDIIDRPGNALRSALVGKFGSAAKSLIPFGETLGLFGQEDRTTGTDVNQALFGLEHNPDDGLLSGTGGLGLLTELVADPLNLAFGLGALTKAGKAAKMVGGGLRQWKRIEELARAGKAVPEIEAFAKLAPEALGGARQVGAAVALDSPLAQAGRYLAQNQLPLELAQDWGQAGRAGQRALLGVGGELAPLPLLPRLGTLPEATLIAGAPILEGLQGTGQWLKAAPGIKHIGQLLSRTPVGLEGDLARNWDEEMEAVKKAEGAAQQQALEEANRLDAALQDTGGMGHATVEDANRVMHDRHLAAQRRLVIDGGMSPEAVARLSPEEAEAAAAKVQRRPVEWPTDPTPAGAVPEAPLVDPAQLVDPTTGEVITLPGGAKGNNPLYLKRIFEEQRQALTKPLQEAAEQAAVAEMKRGDEAAAILEGAQGHEKYLERARVGDKVFYVPDGMRAEYPGRVTAVQPDGRLQIEPLRQPKIDPRDPERARKGIGTQFHRPEDVRIGAAERGRRYREAELSRLPPEMRGLVKAAETDANRLIDEAIAPEMEAFSMQAEGRAGEIGVRRAELRGDYLDRLNLEHSIKGKMAALPAAIQDLLARGYAPQDLPKLKSVEFMSADAAELMAGDKLRLGGDTFTVQASPNPETIRLKDHMELEVPAEAVPKDRGAPIQRAQPLAGPLPPELTPQIPAPTARAQNLAEQVNQAMGQPGAVRVGSELPGVPGEGLRQAVPPPLPPEGIAPHGGQLFPEKPPPTPEEYLAAEIQRVKNEAIQKASAAKKAGEQIPPEIQAQLEKLTADEEAALRAAQYQASQAEALRPKQAPEIEALSSRGQHEIADASAQLSQWTAHRDALDQAIKSLPPEEVGGQTWQQLTKAKMDTTRGLGYFKGWLKTGKRPPLPPIPPEGMIDAFTAKARMSEVTKASAGVAQYLTDAGYGTAQAAEEAAKRIPKELNNPAKLREITQYIETGGDAPEHIKAAGDAITEEMNKMLGTEQGWVVPTSKMQDPRLNYLTRVPTEYGRRWFMKLDPEKRAVMMLALEKARADKGIPGVANQLLEGVAKVLKGPAPEGAQRVAVPFTQKGFGEKVLARLTPETRKMVEENGLAREFVAFDSLIANTHPSQIQRLKMFEGLSIPELNDAFAKVLGAKRAVFNESPAAALLARKARHIRAQAANDLFERMAEKVGAEVPATAAFHPIPELPGISILRDQAGNNMGYGLDLQNGILGQAGKPRVYFDSLDVAKAMQRSTAQFLEPERVSGLLAAWDDVTRMAKSWVTRPFPAYVVRNALSDRMQSWLEGVPVVGAHYKRANLLQAGAWGEPLKLGDGTVLTFDAARKELQEQGITKGTFQQATGLGRKAEKQTWGQRLNPMNPENIAIQAGERVSAAMAGAPGQILSGAGVGKLKDFKANTLEETDRIGHYLYKRMAGEAPAEAAASVKKALFDYGEMNDFERKVLGRAVFFYQYTRNVVPLVLGSMLENPRRVHQLLQVAGGAGGPREGMPEFTPDWMREGLPVPLGKDATGQPQVTYGFGTPIEGAFDPFAGFAKGPQRGVEKLLSQLNPLARVPLELATDRSFFLGQNIREARKAPHWVGDLPPEMQEALGVQEIKNRAGQVTRHEADPYLLYALGSSPLGRLSTTVGKASDEKKGALARALNVLSGVKTVSVDPAQAEYFARKDAAEEELQRLERRGLVKQTPRRYYATPAGKESDEALEIQALRRQQAAKRRY